MSNTAQTLVIDSEHAGRRLDNYLMGVLKNLPKSYVYRIIRSGEVRVNGGRKKANTRLELDDKVRIPPFRQATRDQPVISAQWSESARQRILYEDADCLVFNKPAGIAVHGGSGLDFGVIDVLRRTFGDHLELVHRLDKGTSGCLLVAKSARVGRELQALFRDGLVLKRYLCLVKNHFPSDGLVCEAPLVTQRQESGQAKTRIDAHGKRAETEFSLIENLSSGELACAHLEVTIKTGRTHQIRVHAAHLNHPLAGDQRYGDPGFNASLKALGFTRMYLHASRLEFRHPSQHRRVTVTADESSELRQILTYLAQTET